MNYYIYIKHHSTTNKKYLGMTKQDPYVYKGSGRAWSEHINEHGGDELVTTIVLQQLKSMAEVKRWGQYYSELYNVVESDEWLNLKEEAGWGGYYGSKTRALMKDRWNNPERKQLASDRMAQWHTEHAQQHRDRMQQWHKDNKEYFYRRMKEANPKWGRGPTKKATGPKGRPKGSTVSEEQKERMRQWHRDNKVEWSERNLKGKAHRRKNAIQQGINEATIHNIQSHKKRLR